MWLSDYIYLAKANWEMSYEVIDWDTHWGYHRFYAEKHWFYLTTEKHNENTGGVMKVFSSYTEWENTWWKFCCCVGLRNRLRIHDAILLETLRWETGWGCFIRCPNQAFWALKTEKQNCNTWGTSYMELETRKILRMSKKELLKC